MWGRVAVGTTEDLVVGETDGLLLANFFHALQVIGQILFPISLLSQISSRSSSYLLSPNSSQVIFFP